MKPIGFELTADETNGSSVSVYIDRQIDRQIEYFQSKIFKNLKTSIYIILLPKIFIPEIGSVSSSFSSESTSGRPTSFGVGTNQKNTTIPPTKKTLEVNKKAYYIYQKNEIKLIIKINKNN